MSRESKKPRGGLHAKLALEGVQDGGDLSHPGGGKGGYRSGEKVSDDELHLDSCSSALVRGSDACVS